MTTTLKMGKDKVVRKVVDPIFKIDLGDGIMINVFEDIAFSPNEQGKCKLWIDGEPFDFHGLTGRQQIDFLNRVCGCWTSMFKRARKKATVEMFEADLAS